MPAFNNNKRWTSSLGSAGVISTFHLASQRIYLGAGSRLLGINRFSGEIELDAGLNIDPRCIATFGGQVVMSDDSDDSTLYIYNLKKDKLVQFIKVSGFVYWMKAIGRKLIVVSDKGVHRIEKQSGFWKVVKSNGIKSRTVPGYAKGKIFIANDDRLICIPIDDAELKPAWSDSFKLNGNMNNPPAADDKVVLVASWKDANTVYCIDVETGSAKWSIALPTEIVAKIGIGDNEVYVPGADNAIYVLDKNNGKIIGHVGVAKRMDYGLMVNPLDNILYASAGNKIYAYAADTDNLLDLDVGGGAFVIGPNASEIYCYGGASLHKFSFVEALKTFSVESHLMQDFELAGTEVQKDQGLKKKSTFITDAILHNPDKSALAKTKVKVKSTDNVEVLINGQNFQLKKDSYLEVETDGSGRLRIESDAKGISTPGILINLPSFAPGEDIVAYPDHGLHEKLANQSSSDLRDARDYDGNLVVDSTVSDQHVDDAAKAIQSSLGMTMKARTGSNTVQAQRKRSTQTDQSDINKSAFFITKPSELNPKMELPTNWQLIQHPGGSQYNENVSQAIINKWTIDNAGEMKKRSSGSLWDFIEAGGKIFNAIVHESEEIIGEIKAKVKILVDDVEHAFEVILDSIEKAVKLVQGILQNIVKNIVKAVEWLSSLFDWKAILQTHDEIKNTILSSLDYLKTTGIAEAKRYTQEALVGMEKKIDDMFDNMRASIGEDSFNSHKSDKGEKYTDSKSTWLLHKTKQNMHNPDDNSKRSINPVEAIKLSDDLWNAISTMFANLGNDIKGDFNQIIDQLHEGFKNMNGSDILAGSFATILTLLQGIIDIIMDVVINLSAGLLDIFQVLLNDDVILGLLNSELPIPFVKDFYKYLTGNSMSVLDIISLLIAIPISVLEKVKSRSQKRSISSGLMLGKIGKLLAGIAWAIADAFIEVLAIPNIEGNESMKLIQSGNNVERKSDWNPKITGSLGIGLPAIVQIFAIPGLFSEEPLEEELKKAFWPLWAFACGPIILDFVFVLIGEHRIARFEKLGQGILTLNGVIFYALLFTFIGTNDKFKEEKLAITSFSLANVFMLIKWLRTVAPTKGPVICAIVDGSTNAIAAVVDAADEFT